MRVAWYFGFGWAAIATLVVSGVAINRLDGWARWACYVPFLIAGLHMTIRFRSFSTNPWRRVHSKAMLAYGELATQEYAAAKEGNREFDIGIPCRGLAVLMFGEDRARQLAALLEGGRKDYYNNLVASYPQVFVEGIKAERHEITLAGVRRDIDASQLGPDILIAKAIELEHGGLEAARYLRALLLGLVR
jgi:hypothetical protein